MNNAKAELDVDAPNQRNLGLDVARATAISLVVAAHYCGPVNRIGIFGVELFFGLSGYLIGGILIRTLLRPDGITWKHIVIFWQRRWWRTIPNYVLFLVLSFVFPPPNSMAPTGVDAAMYLAFAQNIFIAGQSFFGVSWSLCIEEWFYLMFPLLIFAAIKCGINRRHIVVASTVLLAIVSLAVRAILVDEGRTSLDIRMLTFGRLDAIGFGVLVASIALNNPPTQQTRRRLALLGTTMVCLGIVTYPYEQATYIWSNVAAVFLPFGFALMLPWLENSAHLHLPSFGRTTIRNLSLWSYSVYLSHMPVLLMVYDIAGKHRSQLHVNVICRIAALICTVVSSAIIFRLFESKMTQFRPAELQSPSQ